MLRPRWSLTRVPPPSSVSALATTVTGFASSHCLDNAIPLFEVGFLAAAVPHLCAAHEGDPGALDIPIPRTHVEAILGPWASYWIAAEEAEMASYRSTSTYVDTVPPPRTNVVNYMSLYKRNYELHSLDFSTAFLQGSLHEQIWLPLDFFPLSSHPSLFVRRGSTPFFVLVYILTRFRFPFSKVQLTALAVDHGLTAPPSDEPFESNGPYPELVSCLMYLMICTRPDIAYPLSVLARFVVPRRHRPSHWYTAKRLAKSAVLLCDEARLVGKAKLHYFLMREVQQCGQTLLRRVVSEANSADIFTKALPPYSRDVTFDESVSFFVHYPNRGLSAPPPPLFLVPTPPHGPAPMMLPPHLGPASSGAGAGGTGVKCAGFVVAPAGCVGPQQQQQQPRSLPLVSGLCLLGLSPPLPVHSLPSLEYGPLFYPLDATGEFALGYDVIEGKHFGLNFLAAAATHLYEMLLSPEGDPEAPDILTPRTYIEVVSKQWTSKWIADMDLEMVSWRSTGMYVKRPPGSPPVFKVRKVARGRIPPDAPEPPQPPAPPVPPAPPAPPVPPTPPAPPVPPSPPCSVAPHVTDKHPVLTLLLPSAFDEYLSEPDYDKSPDVDVPAPAPAPRWGQPEDFTWDESAVGADVQDAEEGWRAEGDADAEGGIEADTEAATEAGTAEDVFPEGAPGGDDDDGNRVSCPPSLRHKPNDHKRQAYTAAEKLKWVAQLDVAVLVLPLARESGIHRKCLANWKRAADFLKEAHSARCRMHSRGRASWYHPMEIKVYERDCSTGDAREPRYVAEQCKKFWHFVRDKRRERGIETTWIINAVQTPLWLEMPATTTVDQTGVRSVPIRSVGYQKERVTVMLACMADGMKLKPWVFFKRKTVPKGMFLPDVVVACHENGWMDVEGVIQWLKECVKPFLKPGFRRHARSSMVVQDSYRGHLTEGVKEKFRELTCVLAIIPSGCTAEVQPLDVSINKRFKASVRQQYQKWFREEGQEQLTRAGKLKKPPPEVVVRWISRAWKAEPADLIKRAFLTCGITNALDGSEDGLAMAQRRSQLTAEGGVDDSIIADGFFGNNCQEPESDEEE
ncbi:unnamed protein product [Closterium sp. NIES-53]